MWHARAQPPPKKLQNRTSHVTPIPPQVWDLLDAILPAADAAHTELLRALTGRLEGSELSDGCRGRLQAFGAALAAA
eukprot:scaffold3558_cov127-Isochrysis_galbana.AAC.3